MKEYIAKVAEGENLTEEEAKAMVEEAQPDEPTLFGEEQKDGR